jgi:hypothetical protein
MKTILFILAFFHQPIAWDSVHKLQWDNYQGIYDGSGVSASSCTEIVMEESLDSAGGAIFTIKALFHPESSFISPSCSKSAYSLKHEQLHFDITELYARDLRAKLEPLQHTHLQANIDIARYYYEIVIEAWGLGQAAYDNQTMHSQNEENQLKWERFIHLRLKNFKANVNESSPRLRTIRRQQGAY